MTYDPSGLITDATDSIDGSGDDFITEYSYDAAENLTSIYTTSWHEGETPGGSPAKLVLRGRHVQRSRPSDRRLGLV